ncbi:Transcriptional regulator [Candidatus Arthromitus sp. SFB-mouse-NL]|uniref:helix-turn-helix domain-containing protein n=1 Tax=Candidatus Arthromitus sp. SFB-mouse-NL TaxID=1508644 RepID=UPI000499E0AA|nr:helix-turn-helix transcriptional regulator [Candidatus Arthromitus sp. SFB-mouse-NL]AID44786.1 Transcriptional regulator [Candidatus Arthromitus sp. SFB-mouse-NL]
MENNFKNKHRDKYIKIGLNISLQRKLKNMTQVELSEAINISRTHISNIEAPNMVTPVSLEVIFDIADALDIQPEILFKMD